MPISSNVVLTTEHLDHVVKHFERFGAFAFDTEGIGQYRGVPAHTQITWLSMATHGMSVAIPMGHERGDRIIGERKEPYETKTGRIQQRTVKIWEPAPEQLRPSQVFSALEPLMFSDRIKVCHNAPFDLGSVAKYYDGNAPSKPWFDTYINSVLVDENRLNGLKPRTKELYGVSYDTESVGRCVEKHPFSTVARYAYMDAKYTWLMYLRERGLCEQYGLQGVLALETDVIETVLEMILAGAPINGSVLAGFGKVLDARLVGIEAEIYRAAGKQFNLNSPKQKAELFYSPKVEGGLGLKPKSLTPGGKKKYKRGEELLVTDFSTDSKSLQPHAKHPVIAGVLKYQKDDKLKSTYVDGVLGVADDPDKPCLVVDGRVHSSFNQMGARTGRWSSNGPNLQNIPSRGEDGKVIRSAYQALPGHKLVIADYGQIELVLLAHFIGFGAMFDGFHNGVDPHTMTASLIFGVPPEEVTKEQRTICKAINFGIVYGAGPSTLSEMAGIGAQAMKGHLSDHRDEFPEIYSYRSHVIETARRQDPPHTRTLLGRMRRLPDLVSYDDELRAAAERQIFNSKIQGSGGDVIKLAMVRLLPLLPEDAELVMTVHDELVVHGPEQQVPQIVSALREAMLGESIQELLRVPLTSDVSVVDTWSAAK
ncbi:DNA polymerase [Nonomuraea typhae]|uniref:DNA polymerase I n=1 Tax=Nonomuraea typhae TaxID=2603600 RepID=A0ABW7YJ57_9ACTN